MQDSLDPIHVTTVPRLPGRPVDAHKGTFGKVLVVAGSMGMSGAAVLAGSGALRGGAGLVQVAVPDAVVGIVAASNPCYMTVPLPADVAGRLARIAQPRLLELVEAASAVVVGPGLGQSEEVADLVRALVAQTPVPLLLDADALNVLGANPAILKKRSAPLLLTPHPGEFARLSGADARSIQADRTGKARAFAETFGGVLVLKGAGTVVTDGRQVYVNTTGNPGMATGGSGDVLSGLLGALLAGGQEAFAAAVLGVYLHGKAGDLARDARGETSLIATDLVEYLPAAFKEHTQARSASAGA
jgi:NAD(P)H-hydrate epimerase